MPRPVTPSEQLCAELARFRDELEADLRVGEAEFEDGR